MLESWFQMTFPTKRKKKKYNGKKMPGEGKQKTGSLVSLSSVKPGDGRDREVPLVFRALGE